MAAVNGISLVIKNEKVDWDKINSSLKLNGYEQLNIKFSSKDELYFDQYGSVELRCLISDLLESNVKRNQFIKDSLDSTDRLKSQLKDNDFMIRRYEETIRNLNDVLLETRHQMKEMKTEHAQNVPTQLSIGDRSDHCETGASEESRRILVSRYHNLEKICEEQRNQINQLQLKLNRFVNLEDSRIKRQQDVFQQLRHKSPNSYNALDKRLLEIIDSYETKLLQMEKHITFFSSLGFCLPLDDISLDLASSESRIVPDSGTRTVSTVMTVGRMANNSNADSLTDVTTTVRTVDHITDDYRHLIARLQREIEDSHRTTKGVEEKYELLKLDCNNRPSAEEMKELVAKMREYKRLLEIHNIRPEKERSLRKKPGRRCSSPESESEYPEYRREDIVFLPLRTCQRYLSELCAHLNASSLRETFSNLVDLLRMNAEYPSYFSLSARLAGLLDSPQLPPSLRPPSSRQPGRALTDRYHELVEALDLWGHEMSCMPQLAGAINELQLILFPWKRDKVRFTDTGLSGLISQVQWLVANCASDTDNDIDKASSNKSTCEHGNRRPNSARDHRNEPKLPAGLTVGLVEHYCSLFECNDKRAATIFAHMNQTFARLGETSNVISVLKQLLGVGDSSGYACLVAEVDSLQQISRLQTEQHLDDLQLTTDMELLVRKLEEYEKFVPDFQRFVEGVIDELGLDSIDEILPRIKSLLMASSLINR